MLSRWASSGVLHPEHRDGMRVAWDVPITMDDGVVLRADVFRPWRRGRIPWS
jgi:predicted acyl esterase